MSLRTNLVSYYELNETSGTTATDAHGTNDGTYNGNLPTAVAGIQGNAQSFDGTGDFINIPDNATLDFGTGAFSISAWVKFDGTGSLEVIVHKGDGFGSTDTYYALYKPTSDTARLIMNDGTGDDIITGSTDISDGSWYFITGTRDASGNLNLYVNGESDATEVSTTPADTDTANDLRIGATSGGGSLITGDIDEVAIHSTDLSLQEHKELYNNGIGRDYATTEFDGTNWDGYDEYTSDNTKVANANDNLMIDLGVHASAGFWSSVASDGSDIRLVNSAGDLAYPTELENFDSTAETGIVYFHSLGLETASDTTYRLYAGNTGASAPAEGDPLGKHAVWNTSIDLRGGLGESSGSAIDSTRNSFDGTFNGNLPTQVSGQLGNAQDLDGTGDYIDYGDNLEYDHDDAFSITAWIDTSVTADQTIFSKQNNSGDFDGYNFRVDDSFGGGGALVFVVRDDGSNRFEVATDNSYNDGALHKVRITYDGTGASGVTFYVDGSSVASTIQTNTGTVSSILNNAIANVGSRGGGALFFNGIVDEIRVESLEQTANWETTEYNNQSDNTNFWTATGNFGAGRRRAGFNTFF